MRAVFEKPDVSQQRGDVSNPYVLSATVIGVPPSLGKRIRSKSSGSAPMKDSTNTTSEQGSFQMTSEKGRDNKILKASKSGKCLKDSSIARRKTMPKNSNEKAKSRANVAPLRKQGRDASARARNPNAPSSRKRQRVSKASIKGTTKCRQLLVEKVPKAPKSLKGWKGKWPEGTRMCKYFPEHGTFYGKIVGCERESGTGRLLYSILYDDGDEEDLWGKELAPLIKKAAQKLESKRASRKYLKKTSQTSNLKGGEIRRNQNSTCIECQEKITSNGGLAYGLCSKCFRRHASLKKSLKKLEMPKTWSSTSDAVDDGQDETRSRAKKSRRNFSE